MYFPLTSTFCYTGNKMLGVLVSTTTPCFLFIDCGSCYMINVGSVAGIIASDIILTILITITVFCLGSHHSRRRKSDSHDGEHLFCKFKWELNVQGLTGLFYHRKKKSNIILSKENNSWSDWIPLPGKAELYFATVTSLNLNNTSDFEGFVCRDFMAYFLFISGVTRSPVRHIQWAAPL